MKIGDRVKCTRSDDPELYSVDTLYVVEGFGYGGMLLRDDKGGLDRIPIPMKGAFWDFEPVNEEVLERLKKD